MTLSSEQLRAGTEQVETGRVRLRKFVTTEQVEQTVPVTRDEVLLERESITSRPGTGGTLSEEEREVVLREKRPVVAKQVVPVEQIRVGTQRVTEQQPVCTELRREELEVIDGRR